MEEVDIFDELEKMLKAEEIAKEKGVATAKVTKVERGLRKDFFDEKKLEELGMNANDEVLVIHYETEWGETLREVYRVSTHRRSNLYKFFLNYGRPVEGKEVTIRFDKAKGRWRILI